MRRFFVYGLISLCISCTGFSQWFIYSKSEIRFDENREQVRIIPASGGFLHVWKYGLSGVSLSVFSGNLELLRTKKLSTRLINMAFIRNADFYYIILSDSSNTEIYAVEKDGTCTEKTRSFDKQNLTLGVHHSYSFRQGDGIIFLLQQINDIDQQKSFLYLTALDTNLNYINKMVLKIEYIGGQPQNLLLSSLDNQLLLLNHTISKGAEALAFTKINVVNGTFFTKFFYPEGLQFISHQLLFDGNEIILKSQVRETGQRAERPKAYTYFIKLNNRLEITNNLYLNSPDLRELQNPFYFYNPSLAVVLPGKQLLTIDFGRKENKKSPGSDELLRFLWIDSGLRIVKSFNQSSGEGKYFPVFLFNSEKGLHLYYEETISNKVKMINTYELADSLVNDKPLLLIPTYKYMLRRSVPVNESSFVIPYTRNFHLGLVKVNADMD